ncbi:MAG: hypothetical protein HYU41_19060 [Candidatus Rokubacteria bacterium]|nr:hypothetical protein [Candidatus Rokubacteria bacterium]
MRIFRPEIEIALKAVGVLTLLSLIVIPVAWGYGQRQKARTWQNLACAYRIKEVERRTPILSRIEPGRDACVTLERLGFALDVPR